MGLTHGDGKHVDHINGDKLDNRRRNLRIVTHKQNMFNRRFKRVAKSGYRGVAQTPRGRWKACIGRKLAYIGTYDTKEEAALAYNTRALEMFQHATLNIIV